MPKTTKLKAAIETGIAQRIEHGFRKHLGASIVGRECGRSIWYEHRWAKAANHAPRIQQLFERGHREEEVFIENLRNAGLTVWPHHPRTGEQFKVVDIDGHFSGSLDCVSKGAPELPDETMVDEFKTHNDKSFKQLLKHGVEKAHPSHYIQGTLYSYKKGFKWFLYCAVNKDNDETYYEYVRVKKSVATKYLKRAKYIVYADEPPPRIARTKTHFKCKMCRFHQICWGTEIPAINCRTCGWSEPRTDGNWHCGNPESVTEDLDVYKGCSQHMFDPGMLAKFKPEFVATKKYDLLDTDGKPLNLAKGYLQLELDGKKFKHSPEHKTSAQLFRKFNG